MIKLENILYADYEKYDGKNATVLSDGKVVKGKLSYDDDKLFFCCDNLNFDGYTCSKKYGYTYSWNLSSHCLDGATLEDGEELNIPELRFSKLSVAGSKVKFKIPDEIYEKLKALKNFGEISLLKDFIITFDSSSRFTCGCVKFRISGINTGRAISFTDRGTAKKVYRRFLSYYLPEVEMEGVKYKVAYPITFKSSDIIFQNRLTIDKGEFINRVVGGGLIKYVNEFLVAGFVLPVKASTKEEYIQKAINYLYKLGCKAFKIRKDDCGNNILTSFSTWTSQKGTEYIYARYVLNEYDWCNDWAKKSDCVEIYTSGANNKPVYYINDERVLANTFVSISGKRCLLCSASKIDGVRMDGSEVETYASRDELTLDWHLKENMVEVNGYKYHKNTLKRQDIFKCDNCGKYYFVNHYLHQIGNSKLCRNCACASEEKFHSYGYKPSCLFHHIKDEDKTKLYLGMELEFGCADTNNIVNFISDYLGEKENIAYMKRDASVQGIELVFQPYTFKAFKEMTNKQLYPLLKKLISKGCKGHNEGGIHIHTSLDAWSPDQLVNLYTFFYSHTENHAFIKRVAQRKEKLDHWASLTNINVSNHENDIKEKYYMDISSSRYTALNMTRHTLEFRIFNSSLRYDRVLKNAEFVYSLFEFTKTDNPMYVKDYLNWLKNNSEEYKELIDFLNETEEV